MSDEQELETMMLKMQAQMTLESPMSTTSQEETPKKGDLYAVFVPNTPERHVFSRLQDVKAFIATANKDGVVGTRFKKCADESDVDSFYAEQLQDDEVNKRTASETGEPISPYRSLPTARFNEFRRTIEKRDNEKFEELLKENPRFIINTNNDTPTIIQEGYRYNSLHVACRSANYYVVHRVLELIGDFQWLTDCYATDSCVEERADFLLNAFLNTPDLTENNVPLHYACKYGQPEIVDALLSHRVCKKHPRNKYNERPLDVLCRAFKGSQEEKERISLEITARLHGRQTPSPGRSFTSTPNTSSISTPRHTIGGAAGGEEKKPAPLPAADTPSPLSALAEQMRTKLVIADTPPSFRVPSTSLPRPPAFDKSEDKDMEEGPADKDEDETGEEKFVDALEGSSEEEGSAAEHSGSSYDEDEKDDDEEEEDRPTFCSIL